MILIDMCGQTFGSLQVVCLSKNTSNSGERMWVCECECGKIVYVRGNDLRAGLRDCCPECARKRGIERRSETMAAKPKESKPVYEPKEDCRAYIGDRCAGLKEMFCKTKGECKFYKPKEKGEA